MRYFIIVVSIVWVGVFIWSRMDYKRRNRQYNKTKDKPPFRSEEDLKGYEKPLEDKDYNPVDFDDAQ